MPPKSKAKPQQKTQPAAPTKPPTPATQPTTQQYKLTKPEHLAKCLSDEAIAKTGAGFSTHSAHQNFPQMIKLQRDDIRGRYVSASKAIKAGIAVLPDSLPWSYALQDDITKKACASCNVQFTAKTQPIQCSKCMITLCCSRKCFNDIGILHSHECEAIGKLSEMQFHGDTVFLRIIIRALVTRQLQIAYEREVQAKLPLSKRNPTLANFKSKPTLLWEEISGLMTHSDKLSTSTITDVTAIMRQLQSAVGLTWWDAEQSIYARYLYFMLLINKFPIKSQFGHVVGYGLYLYPSYFNHSDAPNCIVEYGSNQKLTIRSLREIKAGEELTIAYGELYQPSWVRRSALKQLFHFDPASVNIPTDRYQVDNRVKDDYHIGGVKCIQCDNGVLNYHQVKHFTQPEQFVLEPISTVKVVTEETTPDEGTDSVTTATATTTTETPEVVVKDWLIVTKPDNCSVVTCYGCKATYPLHVVENWLEHTKQYFIAQRNALSTSYQKMMEIQPKLLNISKLTSKPTTPLSDDELKTTIDLYSNTDKLRTTVQPDVTPPPPLFKLTTTHYLIYMTYQTLLYVAIQSQDVTSVHKYAQLLFICLSNPLYNTAMSDYHEVLLHLGDSQAFLSGHYGTITENTNARSQMIVPADVMRAQLTKAKDYYEQCYAIRRIFYGNEITTNQYITQVQGRLNRLNQILTPSKK
jgi:hypothetical protein